MEKYGELEITNLWENLVTCVPHILHPNISAGGKEKPLHRDEKETDHIRSESNTHKKYWECLEEKRKIS